MVRPGKVEPFLGVVISKELRLLIKQNLVLHPSLNNYYAINIKVKQFISV